MARPPRHMRTASQAPAPADPAASNIGAAQAPFAILDTDTAAVVFGKTAFNARPNERQTVGLDLLVFHRELGAFLTAQGFVHTPTAAPSVENDGPAVTFNEADLFAHSFNLGFNYAQNNLQSPAAVASAVVAAVEAGIVPRGPALKVARKVARIGDATVKALRDFKPVKDEPADEPDEN